MKSVRQICCDVGFHFKLVEAIVCICGTGLIYAPEQVFDGRVHYAVILGICFYLLVTLALMIVYIVDDSNTLLEAMFIAIGAGLNFLASAGLALVYLNQDEKSGYTLALAIVCCINTILMSVDIFTIGYSHVY